MERRVIAIVCIISLFMISCINMCFYSPESKASAKEKDYLICVNNDSVFKSIKKGFEKEGKIVVNHSIADEKYINNENTVVVRMTENEVNKYDNNRNVIIEEDINYNANNLFTSEIIPSLYEPVTPDVKENVGEYTENPEKFIPIKKDECNNTDLIPWNVMMVAGTPHDNDYKGKNVKVAVIDSGIDMHNDLHTKNWIDFSDRVSGYKPTDSTGHGTNMAGVIGAAINDMGIEGIAPEAELYSLKVLNEDNTASLSSIIKAIEWCIDKDIDIINMSFGSKVQSKLLENEIKKAYEHNIIMISAIGNDCDKKQYPAAYEEVIAVGSIDKNMDSSEFCNNAYSDLVAPGEDAKTLGLLGLYQEATGTSVAAAHVTGVAAAVKSMNIACSNKRIIESLEKGAISLPGSVSLVNYEGAVNYLKNDKETANTSKIIKKTKLKIRKMEKKENDMNVKAFWSKKEWNEVNDSNGNGHKSLINAMSPSYFGSESDNLTTKVNNRSITAIACEFTDLNGRLSASGDGNKERNEDGSINYSSENVHCYSPYHGKSQYTLNETLNHLFFLYELARRRIVLNHGLELNPQSYNGDKYYSVYIGQKMKRRIIADMADLYGWVENYFSNWFSMNDNQKKGYMVLGVYLHLVQDIQCHRALVTKDMLYSKADGTLYYGYDVFGKLSGDCRINGSNIIGVSNSSYDIYWELYNKILNNNGIPFVRLKDYLNNSINISISSIGYSGSVGKTLAYEDNPYFYSERYSTGKWFSEAYIDRMKSDTGNITSYNSYFAVESVPLFQGKMLARGKK